MQQLLQYSENRWRCTDDRPTRSMPQSSQHNQRNSQIPLIVSRSCWHAGPQQEDYLHQVPLSVVVRLLLWHVLCTRGCQVALSDAAALARAEQAPRLTMLAVQRLQSWVRLCGMCVGSTKSWCLDVMQMPLGVALSDKRTWCPIRHRQATGLASSLQVPPLEISPRSGADPFQRLVSHAIDKL